MNVQPFLTLLGLQVILFLIPPLIGATLLFKGFQLFKIPNITYGLCAKAYFSAFFTSYLLVMLFGFLARDLTGMAFLRAAVFLLAQAAILPLLLQTYHRKALLVEAGVVVLTVTIFFLLLLLTQGVPNALGTERNRDRQGKAVSSQFSKDHGS